MDTPATQTALEIAREFLLGDVMVAAMKQLRALDKPWLKLTEEHQERVIREVRHDVAVAVEAAVIIIASDKRTVFHAGVDSVTFKEGVKAVLTMPNTQASHELADVAGNSVLVVIENPSRYTMGADNVPQAEKVQRELAT